MIVVDASVLANMLVYADERGRRARAALGRDVEWAAPEHWMVEVFSVVRGLWLGGKITLALAERTVDRLASIAMDHVPVVSLLPLMWKYRNEMSAYDCAYVTLAATRGVPMVTADERLAAAAQRHCTVTLVA